MKQGKLILSLSMAFAAVGMIANIHTADAATFGTRLPEVPKLVDPMTLNSAELNARDSTGNTPLTLAVRHENAQLETIKQLLNRGALPNVPDNNKMTPLHWAARKGHANIMTLLIKRGGVVNAQDSFGMTPLMFAAGNNAPELVEVLLKNMAFVDEADNENRTPLMEAAYFGHADIAALLIKYGAKPDAKDDSGKTAIDIARAAKKRGEWTPENDHDAVVTLLKQKMPIFSPPAP